jgi:hypothetical protein
MSQILKPADVVLVEGKRRISAQRRTIPGVQKNVPARIFPSANENRSSIAQASAS